MMQPQMMMTTGVRQLLTADAERASVVADIYNFPRDRARTREISARQITGS
jgi:hypothetical protein